MGFHESGTSFRGVLIGIGWKHEGNFLLPGRALRVVKLQPEDEYSSARPARETDLFRVKSIPLKCPGARASVLARLCIHGERFSYTAGNPTAFSPFLALVLRTGVLELPPPSGEDGRARRSGREPARHVFHLCTTGKTGIRRFLGFSLGILRRTIRE